MTNYERIKRMTVEEMAEWLQDGMRTPLGYNEQIAHISYSLRRPAAGRSPGPHNTKRETP